MTKKRHLFVRNAVAILAATPLLWIAPGVNAQSSSPSSQESRTSPNSDITRQELARFDQFLDGHQEIAQQLRQDPSLVNDQNYVRGHPELQTFLQDHPGVREEIKEIQIISCGRKIVMIAAKTRATTTTAAKS